MQSGGGGLVEKEKKLHYLGCSSETQYAFKGDLSSNIYFDETFG
jgi:hypothetical protein